MRLTRNILRRLIKEELNILSEQDDPFGLEGGGEEEGAADEGAETEGEEEGGEDAEGAEGEGEDAEEEDEEEVEEIEPLGDEELSLAKTVDDELNSVFIDFESDAIKSADWSNKKEDEMAVDIKVRESARRKKLSFLLFEREEAPQIDMETFTADVARLIKNYDSLLDMKAIIMKKAQDFISKKYGKEQVEELLSILELRYDLTLDIHQDEIDPHAVGASPTQAEGGA
tara:strand:- start:3638 stop:4321 length:684 start_codon:yes stop_codon:yes gene_type:complete